MSATPEKEHWQDIFLRTLAETGNVKRACRAAKVDRSTAYRLRKANLGFQDAWDEAMEIAVGLLEDEAWRRAREGVLEPVYYKGDKVGSLRKYSDTLLIFLLKAHNPAKYRENIDITSGGQPIKGYIGFTPDEWDDQADTED